MRGLKLLLFTCSVILSFGVWGQIFVDNTLPYYTDPSKISTIKVGDSFDALTSKLEIQPYDVFHINGEGSTLISYKYRLKLRKVDVEQNLNDQASQTNGQVYYNEEKTAFVLMVNGKVSSVLTSSGIADSKAILVENNTIRYITQAELVNQEMMDTYITEGLFFYYMNNHIEKADNAEGMTLVEEETQPTSDEFKLQTDEVESLSPKSDRDFYSQLPAGRAEFHPENIDSKALINSNLPGKNINGGKVLIGVLVLPTLFFMGKEFTRTDLRSFERQRRMYLYRIQNKNLSKRKQDMLWLQVARCEQVILSKYAKLQRKGWSPEKR